MNDDLYHEAIVRLARDATGRGRLDAADGRATVDNPLCGDRVTVEVAIADGHIAAVGHQTRGCVLCEAAAAVIGQGAPGATPSSIDESAATLQAILSGGNAEATGRWAALAAFRPVAAKRSRHDCVRLPFTALREAMAQATEQATRSTRGAAGSR